MTLIQLLLTRRYTSQTGGLIAFQTLVNLAQTHEFKGHTHMFSKRRKVEQLVELLHDINPIAEPDNT